MSKELEDVKRKIERLEGITKRKAHGKTSDDLKILQQLSVLYKRRSELVMDAARTAGAVV